MSRPHRIPARRLTCADVRFVEADFPRPLAPRLVLTFNEGISILLEKPAASEPGQRRIKLQTEALQLLLDGVDLREASLKPWYERPE